MNASKESDKSNQEVVSKRVQNDEMNYEIAYDFGGGEGLQGLNLLFLGTSIDSIHEEGILEFAFVVKPDGTVSSVKAMPTTKLELKKVGMASIPNWRFSPFEEADSVKLRVKIVFKMKK